MLVARTATQITRDRLPNLVFVRLRVLVQVRLESHQKAGRTKPALKPVRLPERLLQRMQSSQLPIVAHCQTLNSHYLMTIRLNSKENTRSHGFAIIQNSTGTTSALFATYMRSSQLKLLSQEITQQHTWLDIPRILLIIHR
jgi:hypothetical protein